MTENKNCDICPKLKDYATANKLLLKQRDELESEVDGLHTQIETLHNQIAVLQQQIPKPKPNLLGAGRKPKVTPKIIECALKLRKDGLSFGDIAIAINEVSDIKISRSTAYEIYDKYGRAQSSFLSDKLLPEAVKTSVTE